MAKLRRPHVVPAGYQRNFADGERILLIDKAGHESRPVGVRDNFVASHFLRVIINGEASDPAEDEFARIENAVLPQIKAVKPFVQRTDSQSMAVKATMAMLWARSFSREVVVRRIRKQVVDHFRRSTPSDPEAHEAFERDLGRAPSPGELEEIVEKAAERLIKDRLHDINSMMQHYNEALKRFEPLHLSLYQAHPSCEFITSDNPVLLARTNQLIQVGAQSGLALGDASFIFLPVTRFIGACLTIRDEGDLQLDRITNIRLNHAMWRNAVERVACHPSLDDWQAACNVRG